MNIISFEERTFEGIAAKFEYFVQRVDNLCRRHGERKIDEWMDNHDVCQKLRISPRTLQTLRDMIWPPPQKKKVGQVNKKFTYKEFGISPDSFRLILI